jgi:hypothetical protein
MSIIDSIDPLFVKKSYTISPTRIFLKLTRKKIEGTSEEQIKFVQMRLLAAIDQTMQGPFSRPLEISSWHLPELYRMLRALPSEYPPSWKDKIIPFGIDFRYSKNIFEGVVFDFFLSVSSQSKIWNEKPPSVTLTSLRAHVSRWDNAETGDASNGHTEGYPIWERKGLSIRLRSDAVNVGRIYSFRLVGDGIVTTFWTRLLERSYRLTV